MADSPALKKIKEFSIALKDAFYALSFWKRAIISSFLGAVAGSSFLGFINRYALYWYAYTRGCRVPVEGVPYLDLAVSLLSFALLLVTLGGSIGLYGLLKTALPRSKARVQSEGACAESRANGEHAISSGELGAGRSDNGGNRSAFVVVKNIIRSSLAPVMLLVGSAVLVGLVSNMVSVFKGETVGLKEVIIEAIGNTLTILLFSFIVICVSVTPGIILTVVRILTHDSRYIRLAFVMITVVGFLVIIASLFIPSLYGELLKRTRFGGGYVSIEHRTADNLTMTSLGELILVTNDSYSQPSHRLR